MRIAVVHNAVAADAGADERDVLVQAEAVSAALRVLGHEVAVLPCDLDLATLRRHLEHWGAQRVFNLVESLADSGRLIHLVPSMLEAAGIGYTGSSAEALLFTSNKLLAKRQMRQAGIPTPDWVGDRHHEPPCSDGKDRWIVKSVWEHASLGLDADALLETDTVQTLYRRIASQSQRHGGLWFAERFVPGREFNLSLLADPSAGVRLLPPAEIRFEGFGEHQARIVDWQAKWDEGSFGYQHTPRGFDFALHDGLLLEQLGRIASRLWQLFDLRGFARVDFRVDPQGRPWVLEVNANPCLAPDAGFAAAVAMAGLRFEDAVARILADVQPVPPTGTGEPAPTPPSAGFEASGALAAASIHLRDTPLTTDGTAVRNLTRATGFFTPAEVEVAVELVQERLVKGPSSGYQFLFAENQDGMVAGYTCFGPIPCTLASFDLYWIAVNPSRQGRGLGRRLLCATEAAVRAAGGSRLYIETSCRPQYAATRAFYERCGYRLVALLEDFYAPGDGRGTYLKLL